MFSLAAYMASPNLWRTSHKCSLLELLLFEVAPQSGAHASTQDTLVHEQTRIKELFADCQVKGVNGDDVEKLRVREEGGCPDKTADIYAFHQRIDDPIHLIECKYRYSFSKSDFHGKRVRSVFQELVAKFLSSKQFLVAQQRNVDDMFWVVTNSNIAPVLRNELSDLCIEEGVEYLQIVDSEGLHGGLTALGLPMEGRSA